MSDQFRQWLTSEMKRRRFSQGALAREIGMSRPFVTRVLNGEKQPSVEFCIKVAGALGEAPERLLRLAGILPRSEVDNLVKDELSAEILDLLQHMPKEQRQQILDYVRFLYQQRSDEE